MMPSGEVRMTPSPPTATYWLPVQTTARRVLDVPEVRAVHDVDAEPVVKLLTDEYALVPAAFLARTRQ
jgi:hypothetical protein